MASSTQNIFRLTLRSTRTSVRRIETFLGKINRSVPLDEIQMHKLMVSLTEAVNNAILHGNKSHPEKKVSVVAEVMPNWLLFVITDQGRGFHPELVENPLKEENLLRESGRGIFLMRTLMNKVEFEKVKGGMQIRLWLELLK